MSLSEKLNAYLADQTVMYTKLHNLHWYVVGKSFFTLHVRFEELYDETTEIIDEVAERMLALNLKPVGSLKGALALTKIKELADHDIDSKDAVETLIADLKYLAAETKGIVSLAEEATDVVTADMFTGYLAKYEKTLWMLGAYLR